MEPCKPMLGKFVKIYEGQKTATNSVGKKFDTKKPTTTKIITVEEEIYRPLHLNPVFYEHDSGPKKASREKRRAAKMLLDDADLNQEEDLPVETYFGTSVSDPKFLSKMREKNKYEEENFTRISLTKRENLFQKRYARGELMDTNARIDHIRRLLESSDDEGEMKSSFLKKKTNKKKQVKRANKKRKAGGKRKR